MHDEEPRSGVTPASRWHSAGSRAPGSVRHWTSGRIALVVAGIGMTGMVAGSGWIGLQAALGTVVAGVFGAMLTYAALALAVGGVGLVIGALGFYVIGPGFMGKAMAARGYGSHRLVIACTLLIVLAANGPALAYAALSGPRGICSVPGFLTAALSVDIALLTVAYLRFIRPGVLTLADLGLDRSFSVRHIGQGLLVGVSVLVVSAAIQAVMHALGVQQTQLADLSCIREFPLLGFFGVVFAGGVLAPIAEEIYFRGYVFRSYLTTRGPLVAYGATSVLFATLHLNVPALLPILALSMIFCYAYRRTGSIVPSMVGHALNNTTAFCILYFTNAQV